MTVWCVTVLLCVTIFLWHFFAISNLVVGEYICYVLAEYNLKYNQLV